MGWSFTEGASKSDVIQDLIRFEESDAATRTCLAHCVRGNVLWSVWEIRKKQTDETHRFIGCDLLGSHGDGFGWGYKDMCESMHPYFYSCPLKYLDMVPEVACQEWRDKVQEYHDEKRRRREIVKAAKVGDPLLLNPGCCPRSVVLTSIKPLRGYSGGIGYRIPLKMVALEQDYIQEQ